MTADEILELVAELRRQQKLYFSITTPLGPKKKALLASKELERRVDEALKSYSEAKPTQKELRSYSKNNFDI